MKILKPGTRVITVIGRIEAMIVGVNITSGDIEYRIRYLAQGEERVVWLYRFEIEVAPTKQDIGFSRNQMFSDNVKLIEISNPE